MPVLHPVPGSNAYGRLLGWAASNVQAASALGGVWADAETSGGWWTSAAGAMNDPETALLRFHVRPLLGLNFAPHAGRNEISAPDRVYADPGFDGWQLWLTMFFDSNLPFSVWNSGTIDRVWWNGTDLGAPPPPGGFGEASYFLLVPIALIDTSDAAVLSGPTYEVIVQATYSPQFVGVTQSSLDHSPATGVGLNLFFGFHVDYFLVGHRGGQFHFG